MNIELKGPGHESIFIGSEIYYPDPIILNFGPGSDITRYNWTRDQPIVGRINIEKETTKFQTFQAQEI